MAQGTHGSKVSIHVQKYSINNHILGGINYHIGDNHGWFPKGMHFHKIDIKKIDGNDPII